MGVVASRADLVERRAAWGRAGERVVFTNGCFDLLHPGHVRLLEQASEHGERLVVAVNSDRSVQGLKGPGRPVLPEGDRAAILASLACVDAVTVFDEDTPHALLEVLLPDVLVKGADWAHWIAGREIVEAAGGQVFAIPFERGYSTTNLVASILRMRRR
ncbi:MAG: D-glycero-beta-D-manno-heptose 1-phosphate adenylyltransferase [Bryobacterales bacterium]|nr:D-glycero-beta-D-manno-heptose 1-phosphate adenylyltransferase [Bryobacterales bacterium]